jgi:hypothetical protein
MSPPKKPPPSHPKTTPNRATTPTRRRRSRSTSRRTDAIIRLLDWFQENGFPVDPMTVLAFLLAITILIWVWKH